MGRLLTVLEARALRQVRDCGVITVKNGPDAAARYLELVHRGLVRVSAFDADRKIAKIVDARIPERKAVPALSKTSPREPRAWTQEDSDKIADLVSDGWTFSAIAKELGRTKNSVIGRWGRMCLDMGAQAA